MTGWTGPLVWKGPKGCGVTIHAEGGKMWSYYELKLFVDWVVEVLLKIRTCHYKEDLDEFLSMRFSLL